MLSKAVYEHQVQSNELLYRLFDNNSQGINLSHTGAVRPVYSCVLRTEVLNFLLMRFSWILASTIIAASVI